MKLAGHCLVPVSGVCMAILTNIIVVLRSRSGNHSFDIGECSLQTNEIPCETRGSMEPGLELSCDFCLKAKIDLQICLEEVWIGCAAGVEIARQQGG